MQRVIAGVQKFLNDIAPEQLDEFRALALGQKPEVLLITCSDSRIVPGLILQSVPGLVFVVRNAGNIVPPAGAAISGEAATIEYAIRALNIKNIIVCGHTNCGAMLGLLNRSSVKEMPLVDEWLHYAQPSLDAVCAKHKDQHAGENVEIEELVCQNVLTQLANLKTHSFISDAISAGELGLHGWVFQIETARLLRYDASSDKFVPLDASAPLSAGAIASQI